MNARLKSGCFGGCDSVVLKDRIQVFFMVGSAFSKGSDQVFGRVGFDILDRSDPGFR